jgi:hypothetical protein
MEDFKIFLEKYKPLLELNKKLLYEPNDITPDKKMYYTARRTG